MQTESSEGRRVEIHFNKSEAAVAKLWHKEGESFLPFKAGTESAIADAHNTRTRCSIPRILNV